MSDNPITILYVEDDELTRLMISKYMGDKGVNILEASNGKEGLEKYKEHSPDIVLTDITMPVMTGYEMIEEIVKINPNQKIIVTSGLAEEEKCPVKVETISKPINVVKLTKMIKGEQS
jgi:CheY-like chemotaxis protein